MAASITVDNPAEIVLDLSRLLSRITHATPTGVDRCEMAYARGLLARVPERLSFAAVHPMGFYGRLDRSAVLRFLDVTEQRWSSHGFTSVWDKRRFVASTLAALRPRFSAGSLEDRPRVYLQASPNNLTRPNLVQRILANERARFVCLVHDLIPIEFPEYGRPDGVAKHEARIRTIANLADGILCNSRATLASLHTWLERIPRAREIAVAHLGTTKRKLSGNPVAGSQFVCIGTIEPRKNHLLLLNLWRNFAQLAVGDVPRLIIIGRRGWENEQVVDMLERCAVLKPYVVERNDMSDVEVTETLARAKALLLPSFAEGYGMPVTEALSLGVPVVCSDLAALREAGGEVPDYLDPLDGSSWRDIILDYHRSDSPLRAAQLARLKHWCFPEWGSHMDTVIDLVDRVTQ
ncbi:glycosyltransferase family 4 protein [Sphingomonas sp. AP4-R1]|uniref:glycosyltransferase family 4 protein n=1 Tax=Sphingomonas sp. AP4-R1 TaxID=2735134 RepID=UPI001493CB85|nr:glycosyltransferase family 1 protein [Sphingomonas sp. AP4-R1]QJU57630.1 glycosyltransferase family 4 protein [Sphingomonas sp. AP4-R1]